MSNSSLVSLDDAYQVRHLSHRPAHRRRVWPLDNLIQFAQTQTTDDFLLLRGKRDRAAIVLNFDLRVVRVFILLRRHLILVTSLDDGLVRRTHRRTSAASKRHSIKVLPPAYHATGPLRTD